MRRLLTVICLIATLVRAFPPARAVDFVHISDAHVNVSSSGRFREEGVRDLRRVVAAIRVIKPAFVIVTGDVTELGDEASLARYRSEIDRGGVPVYTVQGNHDRPRDPGVFNRIVGPTHPAFDVEGLRFVGLNLDRADEALAVLEKQIATAPAAGIKHVFTFSHCPLLAPDSAAFSLLPGFASITGQKAVRYLALAQQWRIAGHFAGHLHSQFDVADPYTGTPSLAVPSAVRNVALRLCAVTGGRLSWTVAKAGDWPLAILESAQPHVQWGTARLEGVQRLKIRAVGPSRLRELEVRLGTGPKLPTQPADRPDAVALSLDCTSLKSAVHELRAVAVDEAGNRASFCWRLLIKGGQPAAAVPSSKTPMR
jgi:predicted phosphodiesterase